MLKHAGDWKLEISKSMKEFVTGHLRFIEEFHFNLPFTVLTYVPTTLKKFTELYEHTSGVSLIEMNI